MTQTIADLPPEQRMVLYDKAMDLREKNGWGGTRIAKMIDVSPHTIEAWLYQNHRPDRWQIFPDLKPSSELSYVMGTCYGDACVSHSKITGLYPIGLKVKDREFVEEFNKCVCRILGREKGYSVISSKSGFFIVSSCNKRLHNFLCHSLEDHKPIIERFPSSFVKGFFDSEGWLTYAGRKDRPCVRMANTNLSVLKYIRDLLERHFSIHSHIRIHTRAGESHFIGERKITTTKDCYILEILGHQFIATFYDKIGSSIQRKILRLA